jgi:hypothetical protein
VDKGIMQYVTEPLHIQCYDLKKKKYSLSTTSKSIITVVCALTHQTGKVTIIRFQLLFVFFIFAVGTVQDCVNYYFFIFKNRVKKILVEE